MTMRPNKGYFIDGSALLVHPFSSDWYVGGSAFVSGVFSFILHSKLKELAEWFGLELARIVVDECMPAPANI